MAVGVFPCLASGCGGGADTGAWHLRCNKTRITTTARTLPAVIPAKADPATLFDSFRRHANQSNQQRPLSSRPRGMTRQKQSPQNPTRSHRTRRPRLLRRYGCLLAPARTRSRVCCRRGAKRCASTTASKRAANLRRALHAGLSGEQFALPDAVATLRRVRQRAHDGEIVCVSASDPLNLAGTVLAGDKVPRLPGARVAYRDGVPVAALVAGEITSFAKLSSDDTNAVRRQLLRTPEPSAIAAFRDAGLMPSLAFTPTAARRAAIPTPPARSSMQHTAASPAHQASRTAPR